MKLSLFISLFMLLSVPVMAQKDTIETRIILVGDGGALVNGKAPVMQAIKERFTLDKKTVVVFLGDNIYKEGLPDDQVLTYNEAKAVLDSQINLVNNTAARAFFIPGNHDWNNGGVHGYQAILNEQSYIDVLARSNVQFFPRGGCPGPVEVSLSANVTLVIMDSQWWLHEHDKPGIESDCETKTEEELLAQLEDVMTRNARKLVIFATHHPFKSYGIHGGYFTLKQHIFPLTDANPNYWLPLPLIGSIYPITRSVFGTIQDIPHPKYRQMVDKVSREVRKHPNVIFAAGHEHNLQLIKDSNYHYIVSGSACKTTRVSGNKKALFTDARLGFVVLNISENKNVNTEFYTVGREGGSDSSYKGFLLNFTSVPEVEKNKDTSMPVINYGDAVTVAVNKRFDEASGMKRFLLGDNYRKEWATPVTMPMFNLREEKGGFTIIGIGGGKQTKSLRLKDKQGREWSLRTITKDPEKVVPENFRNTIAEDIVQDYISASHPFGPITVPPLAAAVNVVQATPELFFVPDDPAFGFYRPLFANTVCWLERREPVPQGIDTKSTPKTIQELFEDNDNRIDQESVLRARMLDVLIGDWDRHFDQWRFAEGDTGKGKLYYVIPRDRDQAYFYSEGLLLKYFSRDRLPFLKGFRSEIPGINWFNWSARDFDRIFMTELDKEDWRRVIGSMQTKLTDKVIEDAVKKLPAPIYALSGKEMETKLKGRREHLLTEGLEYYDFVSKYVNVFGSNKKEYFKVSGEGDKVKVEVFKRNSESDSVTKMYSRVFDSRVTEELRLYGLNDDDIFEIKEGTPKGIKIRMVGGKGEDSFDIKSPVKNFIYDFTTGGNHIGHTNRTRMRLSDDPMVNTFNILEHNYNTNRFPIINIAFNAEDKLMLGVGFERITHTFRKQPYATRQRLSTLYAINQGSYRVNYFGEFNQLFGNKDLVVRGQLVHPVLNNFFGLGNTTSFTKPREYYRVRYNFVEADVLLRKRVGSVLQFMAGPTIYNYWNRPDDNKNKILEFPSQIGLDSMSVYDTKTYGGGKIALNINNIANEFFPVRGIEWNTEFSALYGLNVKSKPLTRIISDMTVYAAQNDPAKFVTVARIGGGHIFTEDFEYFQAMSLGQNNFLRGFRKNRYAGQSMAYGSLEFRVQLFENKSYVLPGPIGFVVFNDVGKVWIKNETSKRWHYSYGGGLYIAPFRAILISATVARGEEETLFNISLGRRFNLTF